MNLIRTHKKQENIGIDMQLTSIVVRLLKEAMENNNV
ncbi:hypothetical protein BANRA_04021 [Acinetobacter baumannii]|nr:hypothetical protein BANRA_04021 [Acinetobacter baumannii]